MLPARNLANYLSLGQSYRSNSCAHAPPKRQNMSSEIEILSGTAARKSCFRRRRINARGFSAGDKTLIVLSRCSSMAKSNADSVLLLDFSAFVTSYAFPLVRQRFACVHDDITSDTWLGRYWFNAWTQLSWSKMWNIYTYTNSGVCVKGKKL